jgi:hypothetical protein
MDVATLSGLIGALPGGSVAVIALWFALRKDAQCQAMMTQITDIASKSAVSNVQVASSIDALRDAIRAGTKS